MFTEAARQGAPQILLGRAFALPAVADLGAFHHQRVDVSGRLAKEPFERLAVVPVSAEIARIEEPSFTRVDKQREGIESGVLDPVRRDPERTDWEGLPVAQRPRDLRQRRAPGEELRLAQDAGGDRAHREGQARRVRHESAVVAV